jgi:hypothetical protein
MDATDLHAKTSIPLTLLASRLCMTMVLVGWSQLPCSSSLIIILLTTLYTRFSGSSNMAHSCSRDRLMYWALQDTHITQQTVPFGTGEQTKVTNFSTRQRGKGSSGSANTTPCSRIRMCVACRYSSQHSRAQACTSLLVASHHKPYCSVPSQSLSAQHRSSAQCRRSTQNMGCCLYIIDPAGPKQIPSTTPTASLAPVCEEVCAQRLLLEFVLQHGQHCLTLGHQRPHSQALHCRESLLPVTTHQRTRGCHHVVTHSLRGTCRQHTHKHIDVSCVCSHLEWPRGGTEEASRMTTYTAAASSPMQDASSVSMTGAWCGQCW